jgi:hypothetical protein
MTAAKATDRLLGFYPPLDVGDPEMFTAGLVALFAKYPPDLLATAVCPERGIPLRIKRLNSLNEVKEALDDLYEPIARQIERIARQPRQLPPPPPTPEQKARIAARLAEIKRALA